MRPITAIAVLIFVARPVIAHTGPDEVARPSEYKTAESYTPWTEYVAAM